MGSALDDVIPFVERGQQDRVEVDRPQPIVGFLQTDPLIGERIGNQSSRLPKRNVPPVVMVFTRKCRG